MRVLITGITGFVGSHLADHILEEHPEVEIFGLKRWRSPRENIEHIKDKLTLYDGDLRDLSSMLSVIGEVKPDWVFHLAAQSFVPTSFSSPASTLATNIIGTVNLLEAIRIAEVDPKVHICSSSECYGQVNQEEIPIKETCPLRPASPYAVSKLGEDMLAYMYYQAHGLRTIRSRAFTHTGPRRGEVFVVSSFAKQIAHIEKGIQEPVLWAGNLDSVRTFCDVRDIVRAYWLLLQRGEIGEVYNIGGRETMTIRDMLNKLLKLTDALIEVKIHENLLRPKDVTLQVPDCTKFTKLTGWEPRIPFEQTLQDTLDYWRERA
ncbi:GDP-6-deoxy-D-mannose reductase [subsurface metagenome]